MSDDDDDMSLSKDGDNNVRSEEPKWLDFCMERDRQFGLLADLHIVEAPRWCSKEVKRQSSSALPSNGQRGWQQR
jgi:hypothetical protein